MAANVEVNHQREDLTLDIECANLDKMIRMDAGLVYEPQRNAKGKKKSRLSEARVAVAVRGLGGFQVLD